MRIILFIFGLFAGSFLNVVALRYRPDKFLLSPKVIGGRSLCPSCGVHLKWFELFPLLSFIFQGGRCRMCKARISLHYPVVEILSGLVFAFVPFWVHISYFSSGLEIFAIRALWVMVFLTLLLIAAIDARTNLIPDEANIFLAVLGVFIAVFSMDFDLGKGSFIGSYSLLFGLGQNIFVNRLAAVFAAALLFGVIILISRGRAMGLGDLKLALALAVIFGWPDTVLAIMFAFVVGALFAGGAILVHKKTMKSFVAFGPFLAVGSGLIFFFGFQILQAYFRLFEIFP